MDGKYENDDDFDDHFNGDDLGNFGKLNINSNQKSNNPETVVNNNNNFKGGKNTFVKSDKPIDFGLDEKTDEKTNQIDNKESTGEKEEGKKSKLHSLFDDVNINK
jgi:hypothetical protein